MEPNNSTESIDRLAQSFFMVLVFCSFVSDSYIVFENFLKNNYVQKKLNHYKKLYKVVCGLSFNNYQNDEEGNIIIDDVQNIIKDIDELSETSSISDEIIDKNIQIKVTREEEDAKSVLQSEEIDIKKDDAKQVLQSEEIDIKKEDTKPVLKPNDDIQDDEEEYSNKKNIKTIKTKKIIKKISNKKLDTKNKLL